MRIALPIILVLLAACSAKPVVPQGDGDAVPDVGESSDAGPDSVATPDTAERLLTAPSRRRPGVQSVRPLRCPEGQELIDGRCTPLPPCAGGCAPEAVCVKENGAERCLCRSGYRGNGTTCEALSEADIFAELPAGEESRLALCTRAERADRQDRVTRGICGIEPPSISSLDDVLDALGLGFGGPLSGTTDEVNGRDGNPSWALTIHSAGLGRRQVSVLNPRAVVFTPTTGNLAAKPGFVLVAFARGEPHVEVIAHDRQTGSLQFYLLRFLPACAATQAGCAEADLFEADIERGWVEVSFYDAHDTRGTLFDCAPCHAQGWRAADYAYPSPLMFESYTPWTHWLRDATGDDEESRALETFLEARGHEAAYGGIPMTLVPRSNPTALEFLLVANGYGNGFTDEYVYNGRSVPMFGGLYRPRELQDLAAAGGIIQPPHHEFNPMDPALVASTIEELSAWRDGLGDYPAMDSLIADEEAVAFGVGADEDATGEELLVHVCTHCHHSDLDQGVDRARFAIDRLGSLPPEVLEEAIWRVELPTGNLRAMPPARFRTLSDRQRERIVAYLVSLAEE
jgi:mono/diheme cytochrome c family protein